jgi:hypothetical protein
MSSSTSIAHRGGCRFIAGSPKDFHTKGESIFCGQPVIREGGSWCPQHERAVYLTIKGESRKAA